MTGTEVEEKDLWLRFVGGADPSVHERLYGLYSPWAASIATSLFREYGNPIVERDDYMQNAKIGLLEAMSRYDPLRNVPFRAFAHPRVRGSVLNGLRTMQDRAVRSLEWGLLSDRRPTRDPDDALGLVVDAIVSSSVEYFLEAMSHASYDVDDAYNYTRNRQIETRIRAALEVLPPRQKEVVESHYFRQEPFQDIAARWGLSKGRVSQVHHEALIRIRAIVREL